MRLLIKVIWRKITMNNKISYEEIDEWGRSFEARKYAYRKSHPIYKILALKVTAKGEKRLVVSDWDLGLFNGHNSKELFEDFFMKRAKIWDAEELSKLNDYGFPVKEWYYKNKEKVDLFKEEMNPKKEKDDHTYIDYNSFIYAKNRYVGEKAEKTKLNYSITMVVIYTILAIIITTSFFNSEYYS